MPVIVKDVSDMARYIRGIVGRADHHADSVNEVVLTLAGAILWRADEDPEVMSQGGDLKNVLWVKINRQRYAFSYSHIAKRIEMRAGSTHGAILHSFDNATATSQIRAIFDQL